MDCFFFYQKSMKNADMVELLDISDLGSDEFNSWGFKSLYPYSKGM